MEHGQWSAWDTEAEHPSPLKMEKDKTLGRRNQTQARFWEKKFPDPVDTEIEFKSKKDPFLSQVTGNQHQVSPGDLEPRKCVHVHLTASCPTPSGHLVHVSDVDQEQNSHMGKKSI